jgi:hypothetical protein
MVILMPHRIITLLGAILQTVNVELMSLLKESLGDINNEQIQSWYPHIRPLHFSRNIISTMWDFFPSLPDILNLLQ